MILFCFALPMLLVVVLSVDRGSFSKIRNISSVLNDLLVFFNLFINTTCGNRIKVIAGKRVLYDSDSRGVDEFVGMLLAELQSEERPADMNLAADFAFALLVINSLAPSAAGNEGRVLLISVPKYRPKSYCNYIKCIFSAKKLAVPVDCLSLAEENKFMRQLAGILNGSIFSPKKAVLPNGRIEIDNGENQIFAYLLSTISMNKEIEGGNVTYEGLCLCHNSSIQVGYLCPICLGIYCKFVPVCRHCKTRFVF